MRIPVRTRIRSLCCQAALVQQQMWFADQVNPYRAATLVPIRLRLSGELNIEALAGTLRHILGRHQVLRTRVSLVDGCPVGIVDPVESLRLPLGEWRRPGVAKPAMTSSPGCQAALAAEAARPIDLNRESRPGSGCFG